MLRPVTLFNPIALESEQRFVIRQHQVLRMAVGVVSLPSLRSSELFSPYRLITRMDLSPVLTT